MGSGCVQTAISAQALLSRFRCDLGLSIGPAGALGSSCQVGSWYKIEKITAVQRGSFTATGFHLSENSTKQLDWEGFPNANVTNELTTAPLKPLASGEAFIASASENGLLASLASAEAIDMNTFGLQSVCETYKLPLYVWRVISDRADDSASEGFRSFVGSYAGAGGEMLSQIISDLPGNPESPESYPGIMKALSTEAP